MYSNLNKIVVHRLKKVEDENFSLFNFVNEVNNEIEKHAEEIVDMQRKIDALKVDGIAVEEERKGTIQELEVCNEKVMGLGAIECWC